MPLPSNPNRRRVRVQGRTAAELWAEEIDELGLEIGAEWNSKAAAAAHDLLRRSETRGAAMRMLGRRALSSSALRERLLRKDHAAEVVDRVIAQLQADGWLNDEALGEAIAHAVTARAPAGRRLIEARLKARGIGKEAAARVAGAAISDQDDVQEATRLAGQRMQALRRFDRPAIVRRLSGLLARRGFDEQTIESALRAMGLLSDE